MEEIRQTEAYKQGKRNRELNREYEELCLSRRLYTCNNCGSLNLKLFKFKHYPREDYRGTQKLCQNCWFSFTHFFDHYNKKDQKS